MHNIERDKLDEALGAKLRVYEERPPKALFDRIERTLADSSAEHSLAGEVSERLKSTPRAVVPVTWRRRIVYAVPAAAAVLLALVFTLRFGGGGVDNQGAYELSVSDIQNGSDVYGKDTDMRPEADGALKTALEPALSSGVLSSVSDMLAGMPETVRSEEAADRWLGEKIGLLWGRKAAVEPVAADRKTVSAFSPALYRRLVERAHPDSKAGAKPGGGTLDAVSGAEAQRLWDAVIAEGMSAGKEKGGSAVSVYAGNLGRIFNGGEVSSLSTMQSSDMVMHENSLVVSNPMIQHVPGGDNPPPAPAADEPRLKHNFPISVGIALDFPVSKKISVQTGLNYTFLRSSSETFQTFGYRKTQELHYLGIPLGVVYTPLQTRYFSLYVRGGVMLEKAVYGHVTKEYLAPEEGASGRESDRISVRGVQPSVDVSLGALLSFSPTVGLYAEPGVAYYFEQTNQPSSYRTRNPVNFSLRLGLRFTFR